MSGLSVSERQFLLTIGKATEQGIATDQESLAQVARAEMFMLLDWTDALVSLAARGYIVRQDQQYLLTEQGRTRRGQVQDEPYWPYVYDEYFERANDSPTHAAFCERVYGRNLCQHGMTGMAQLERLVDILHLDSTSQVLELGCGNGMITEHVSDVTGAHITGIDFSRVGIEQAKERTRQKQHRLVFQLGDISDIDASVGIFDTVIAIDVIYFVDAERTINQAKELVQADGQMGIFYSRYSTPGESHEVLPPESTPLAHVLRQGGLAFTTSGFAVDEDVHWQEKIDVLAELQPGFEREGNRWLHRFRLNEAAMAIDRYVRRSRCLYHVRL